MSFYMPSYHSPEWYAPPYNWYSFKVEKKYPWYKETIVVHAKINRIISDSSVIFTLNGSQYDSFMRMSGSFVCGDAHGAEHLFTFQPDDVVTILNSNYDEVRKAWEEKREKYEALLREKQKEKEKEKQKEEEKRNEEKQHVHKEAEEAERMSHFWYRLFHRKKKQNDGN